jgi:hypothetical protein
MRWIWVAFVIGCGGARVSESTNDPAGFHISYPDATNATASVGKRFYAKPTAQCTYDNGREAHWAITGARVETGTLPPGVTLEDGALTGTPSKPGEYAARIKITGITCAGKPYPDQSLDVKITAM